MKNDILYPRMLLLGAIIVFAALWAAFMVGSLFSLLYGLRLWLGL